MALNIVDLPSVGGYFKPKEFASYDALLIEVKQIERDVPTKYGAKDTITVDITAFEDAEAAKRDAVVESVGTRIQQVDLARKLAALGVGAATIVRVVKLEPSNDLPNGAWVFRNVAGPVRDAVIDYAERREAAATAAADEMPDF